MNKTLALGVALSALALTAACGSDDTSASTAAPASTTPAAASTPSAAATPPATTSSSSAAAAGGTVLKGAVGSSADPDAFVISLLDASGAKVTTLPAGQYTIQVHDGSEMHNFHLEGAGVDQTTTVPEKKDTTFTVDLKAGKYTYKCDPHSRMVGTFTVT